MEESETPQVEGVQPAPAEEAEEEKAQLSREEILAASRKENKNGDEKEKQCFAKAGTLGFSAGLLLAGIIIIVTVLTSDRVPVEIFLIISAMQAVQSIIVAVGGSRKIRKVYLAAGIVEGVCSVIFLVLWILQICGVA